MNVSNYTPAEIARYIEMPALAKETIEFLMEEIECLVEETEELSAIVENYGAVADYLAEILEELDRLESDRAYPKSVNLSKIRELVNSGLSDIK
jgi:hypothetical protein